MTSRSNRLLRFLGREQLTEVHPGSVGRKEGYDAPSTRLGIVGCRDEESGARLRSA